MSVQPGTIGGLWAWFQERFPPVVYTVLVACFWFSGVAVGRTLGGGEGWGFLAAPLVWLVFLRLRLFDEVKDYDDDMVAHPERVLSRGLVSLKLLQRIALGVMLVELVLAWSFSGTVLFAWGITYTYTLLMRLEFGVGPFLRRHMVLYAITHNPVVGGMAVILYAASGAEIVSSAAWYVGLVSVASLGFEVGRKTRKPDEERPGHTTYTAALGQGPARALLGATYAGTAAAAVGVVVSLGYATPLGVLVGLAVVLPGVVTLWSAAKRVELGASVSLLLALVAVGVLGVLA